MSLDWTKISEDTIVTSITAIIVAIISILPIKSIYKNRQKIYNWFKKQRLIFFPVNFNIAFSLNFQEGINSGNYFKQIKKNIFNTIDNLNLQKQIKIRDFSDIKKFNNRNEAETFRNKKDIDLIIWGDFTNDFLKIDGENINEINLKFTYGHPDNETGSIGKMIKVDLIVAFKAVTKVLYEQFGPIISNRDFLVTIFCFCLNNARVMKSIIEILSLK